MAIIDLANPTRFLNLANRLLPWLVARDPAASVFGLVCEMWRPTTTSRGPP